MAQKINRWNRSKKRKKQHLFRVLAPKHIRHKLLSTNLSKELRKKYNRRNLFLRKGDSVRIMNGEFKNIKGKITKIDTSRLKVFVENVMKKKNDGSKVSVALDPSNLQIIELVTDKKRTKILERTENKQGEKSRKSEDFQDPEKGGFSRK